MKTELRAIKLHLNITWNDKDTDERLTRMIEDAEIKLNHILGAENIDFTAPGMERNLLFNYISYMWNECEDSFESAYIREILRLRHKYEVLNAKENRKI